MSMTGTTTYCQGSSATANTLNYGQCTLGGGIINSGTNYTAQWYVNTTGVTTIAGSTPHGPAIFNTSPAGGSGSETYIPSTATPGTYYYFCYFSWTTGGTCTPDYTSPAQMITINPSPAALTGTATVCQGRTTTLASATTGGVWGSSAPGIAAVVGGVVTGVAPGTAIISYTIGSCPATRIVTVLAGPSAITPSAPTTICQGTTLAVGSTPGGGSWSSSNPAVGTVSTTGVFDALSGGNVTVTYTNTTSGCFVTKDITVNPIPAPLTGPSGVCLGTTITLGTITPGGAWASSNPGVATVSASGVVSGITVGSTTITYSGCGFVTKDITVHPLPAAITGPATVCEAGASVVLSNATTGGAWSTSDATKATAATTGAGTGTITGVNDGTVTVTYTSALGCIATHAMTVDPIPDPIMGVVPFCQGQSITLTNAIPGGTWSTANPAIATVSSGGWVTGVAGGSVVIAYTNHCAAATVVVSVTPLPPPIDGRDTVCLGTTTALANSNFGGTWTSSAPTIASVPLTSGLVSGVNLGMATITYTMPGGCYTTRNVQVVPMPLAITGDMKACPGTTTTLFNTTTGGAWSSGSPSIATINPVTGIVTGVSAGLADITYTTAAGCQVFASVLINPLPDPIIGADIIYCAADKDTLFNATPGGTWSTLTPGIATIDPTTGVLTVISGGTATFRYALPTGCAVTKSVSVNPAPVATITYNGATNTFYTEPDFAAYQWYNGIQGAIPGATTYRTAALHYTDYWVKVTNGTDDCSAMSPKVAYTPTMGTVDIAADKSRYSVFPNPSAGILFIEAPVVVRAVVASIDGKVLIDQPLAKEVNITKLASGVYMVMLYDDDGVQRSVHRITKQ